MGLAFNIYCIPQAPGAVEWDWLLLQLLGDECIRGPWMTGLALDRETQREFDWDEPSLFAPETNPIFDELHPESGWAQAQGHIEALTALGETKDVVLCGVASEQKYRRDPSKHFKEPCNVGLYRFSKPHHLQVGPEGEWEGHVEELLWLHGTHAPLLEDFLDSPFHRAICVLWPDVTVVADESF